MYKRYGKFRIADYMSSWMVICSMAVYLVACLMLKLSVIYIIFLLLYSSALIYSIWNPNREFFEIVGDVINVKKGKKSNK